MGIYETWNPILHGVHGKVSRDLEGLRTYVGKAFSRLGLDIPEYLPNIDGFAWTVSDSSPIFGVGLQKRREEDFKSFRKAVEMKEEEKWADFVNTGVIPTFFGMRSDGNYQYLSDEKLVVAFHVPRVTRVMVEALKGLMVEIGLVNNLAYLADGVNVEEPHGYVSAGLDRDNDRRAGRLVRDSYRNVREEAIWFSASNDNSTPPQHWLYDSSDILVELRVKPAQPYINTGMAILQMAYILSGKEMPHKSELYLELWHAFLEDNIDRMLVTNRRLESQQQVFDALLYHTVLPCLDPEYAAANNYRPYNAMIFGPKGVGKTMIAAMLAMTRFPYGAVVPISQSLLINDDVGLFPLIKLHREKYGVRFVPIIEDLDKLSSIPATGNALMGTLNSNLANLLAGMGSEQPAVIGTGNDPYIIDPVLREPERLGGLMMVLGTPDYDDRRAMAQHLLNGRPVEGMSLDDVVEYVARRTEGFSQRMIADVVNRLVPINAQHRVGGSPKSSDYVGIVEKLDFGTIDTALEYAMRFYQFGHLKENMAAIRKFFDELGVKSDGAGFLAGVNGNRVPILPKRAVR